MKLDEICDHGGLPFVTECIRYFRGAGMLTAPMFDDPAAVYQSLDEQFEISDPVFKTEMGRTFALLLTLDSSLAVQIPMREIHDHQDHVAKLLAPIAKDVQITKSIDAGFVTLDVTGQLHPNLSNNGARIFNVTQTFASAWRWLDYFMVQQLLTKILHDQTNCVRETIGQDEESSVLILCTDHEQHKVIEIFEDQHFEDYEKTIQLTPASIPELPDLDKSNIADIYEKLGLNDVREKDIDHSMLVDLATEYAEFNNSRPSTAEWILDRISMIFYIVAGLYVLRIVLLLAFGFGADWPI